MTSVLEFMAGYQKARSALWGQPKKTNLALEIARQAERDRELAEERERQKAEARKAKRKPVEKPQRVVVPFPEMKPLWAVRDINFNQHVVDWLVSRVAAERGDDYMPKRRRSMDDIALSLLESFPGVTLNDIKGARRKREIVAARYAVIRSIHEEREDVSLPAIGRWCGMRDHTTILYCLKKDTPGYAKKRYYVKKSQM